MASAKPTTVASHLESLPVERRRDLAPLRSVTVKHLPKGYEETLQYGISYVVPLSIYPPGYLGKADVPLRYVALASQKSHLAAYLMVVVLGEAVARLPVSDYVAPYERSRVKRRP